MPTVTSAKLYPSEAESRGFPLSQAASDLRFQLKSRRREPVQPPPDQSIDQHHHGRHDQRRRQEHIKSSRIASPADRASQASRGNNLPLKVEILGHDARVPRPARRGNHPRHQIRKNSRQDQPPPALPPPEAENRRRFLQVARNRHCCRKYIEQDVSLCSEQHH